MWYKTAKQGSLWTRVNPDFKQQFDDILKQSIVNRNFTKEQAESYPGFIKQGVHKIIDFNLLQEKFQNIVPGVLKHITFHYDPDLNSTGQWDGSSFTMNAKYMQNIRMVNNVMKHELFHGIDAIILKVNTPKRGEFYALPGNFQSSEFKGPNEEKITREQEDLAKQKIKDFLLSKKPALAINEERLEREIEKYYRGAKFAAESIKGDFDLYYGTNKELRGFRAQIEDLFSNEVLMDIYEKYYKNLPNGKKVILKELSGLIQQIVNVQDTGNDYKQSNLFNYLNNETFGNWDKFLKQFDLMLIRNVNPQYIRQIAKYLSEFYISFAKHIETNVADTSESEIL